MSVYFYTYFKIQKFTDIYRKCMYVFTQGQRQTRNPILSNLSTQYTEREQYLLNTKATRAMQKMD